MNPKIDAYLDKVKNWRPELEKLREIVLDCQLTEELKWKNPCYNYKDANIILLGEFKEYCVISFIKGVLLQDSKGILMQQSENSQSVRIAKFTSLEDIIKLEATLKAYIFEAIEVEKAGLKVAYKKVDDYEMPEELTAKFSTNPKLQAAFEALTPGRQKGYLLHFTGSKNPKTREARIDKYVERILAGIGMNDCVCGHSKRMPSCDGSHRFL